MLFDLIYLFLIVLFLTWLLPQFKFARASGLSVIEIQSAFLIKVLVGSLVIWLYMNFYGDRSSSDVFKFYDDGLIIYQELEHSTVNYLKIMSGVDSKDPEVTKVIDKMGNWYKSHQHGVFNDNQTIIRFHALLLPLSREVFHIHTAVACFISLSGLLAFIGFVRRLFHIERWLVWCILLFPQLLFWSSVALKESLMIGVLGGLFYSGGALMYRETTGKSMFLFLILLTCTLTIKTYVFVCLFPGMLLWFLSVRFKQLLKVQTFFALILLQVIMVIMIDFLTGERIAHAIYLKQHDFINEAISVGAGSYFESFVLTDSWLSIILNSPMAYINTMLRPFLWNAHNPLVVFSSIENLILLGLLGYALYRKPVFQKGRVEVWMMLSFITLLAVLVGLGTPVSGALVRYKIPIIPIILTLALASFSTQKTNVR
jgi:hypothetical protein